MQYNLTSDYPNVGDQEIKIISSVIKSKRLSSFSGKMITQYEQELCSYFNVKNAIAVSSGTAALHCALCAVEIGPGDEVLIPATALALSVLPVLFCNATPIFVDTQKDNFDFAYNDLKKKITSRTKAIMPVYMWGYPIDFKKLSNFAKKYSLKIIEDAAQAHGSKYKSKNLGTLGDIGCFSTFESKLIATGEGGFVLTNNNIYAKKIKNFIRHCASFKIKQKLPRVEFNDIGWNYRINELTGALGVAQTKKLAYQIKKRKKHAEYLLKYLKNLKEISVYNQDVGVNVEPNYFSFLIVANDKWQNNKLAKKLYKLGITSDVITYNYRVCYDHPLFKKNKKYLYTKCPNAENLTTRLINLPTYGNLTKKDLDFIVKTIQNTVK